MTMMSMAEELMEPVSPTDQCFNNSVLSISNLCVFESEVPIDDSLIIQFFKECSATINPTFSSIMVTDKHTEKSYWKRVEVDFENHVKIPNFPSGMPKEFYEKCFDEYLSETGLEEFPQSQPLWKVHIIKYPTKNAEGTIIFNFHQSLGDGYSLMCTLFSYIKRADNPSLPLTFPSVKMRSSFADSYGQSSTKKMFKSLNWALSAVVNTVSDFSWGLLKSSFLEDDKTPIRSGKSGVESRPICVSTVKFSLDHIKEIKAKLGVTINDVITSIIFMGSRLYMQEMDKMSTNADSTALVLFNTRMLRNYKSMEDLVNSKNSDDDSTWGNHVATLCVTIPVLTGDDFANPLGIMKKTHEMIKKKRHSSAIYLTDCLLNLISKYAGPKAGSRFLHNTIKNSSMIITNVIGPAEKMSLANHPIRNFYFAVTGCPQNLVISVVSYMGELRIGLVAEKGFIDAQKLKSCVERAFEMTLQAAREIEVPVANI